MDLVELVRSRGLVYWEDEIAKARKAVMWYGIGIIVALVLGLMNVMSPTPDGTLGYVSWGVSAGLTIYAGASQSQLLPFMDAKPWAHWTVIFLMCLFGCVGLLWWVFFYSYNNKAASMIKMAAEAAGLVEDRKSVPIPPPSRANSQQLTTFSGLTPPQPAREYVEWVQQLDNHLESSKLPTRSIHFRKEALAYGYVNQLSPAEFLRSGYNQSADPALISSTEVTVAEQETTADATLAHELQPTPTQTMVSPDSPVFGQLGAPEIEKLERLAALHRTGALSDAEFEAEKRRILDRHT